MTYTKKDLDYLKSSFQKSKEFESMVFDMVKPLNQVGFLSALSDFNSALEQKISDLENDYWGWFEASRKSLEDQDVLKNECRLMDQQFSSKDSCVEYADDFCISTYGSKGLTDIILVNFKIDENDQFVEISREEAYAGNEFGYEPRIGAGYEQPF
jgi:hypothetical protein